MLALFGGALAVFCIYAFLLWWGLRRSRSHAPDPSTGDPPPMSVIVAARNEDDSLPELLEALDQQTHPSYEVVIVDDDSTDETPAIAAEWAAARSYATLVQVSEPAFPRKKNALAKGIRAAQHDLLAFTDADCRPPPEWLSVLARTHTSGDTDRVLVGYSPVEGTGLLGTYARYETLLAGLYTTAAIGLGRPYMAVGRNLSYPRAVFDAVNGFSHAGGGETSLSGDDDLFIQAVRRSSDADICAVLDPRSFVPTEGPPSWRAWLESRRRHASAARHYDWTVNVHLTVLHLSLMLLWIAPFVLGTRGLGLLATALLARHSSLGPAAEMFDETDLLALFPLWEFGYALYHLIVVPLGVLHPPDEWG